MASMEKIKDRVVKELANIAEYNHLNPNLLEIFVEDDYRNDSIVFTIRSTNNKNDITYIQHTISNYELYE